MGPVLDLYTSGRHSGVRIMDIDDVADAHDEFLNKTDPTADIKAFFKTPSCARSTKIAYEL